MRESEYILQTFKINTANEYNVQKVFVNDHFVMTYLLS